MNGTKAFSLLLCAGLAGSLLAGGDTWNQAAGGAWGDAANWKNKTVPGGKTDADVAYLPAFPAPVTITHTGTTDLNAFSFVGDGIYTVSGGAFNLYGAGSGDQKRGVWIPEGKGTLTLACDVTTKGNVPLFVNAGATLKTDGTVRLSGNGDSWTVKKGAGTWEIGGTLVLDKDNFGVTKGVLDIRPGAEVASVPVDVWATGLAVGREANSPAAIYVRKGAAWNSGNHQILLAQRMGAPGAFIVEGGTVTGTRLIAGWGDEVGALDVCGSVVVSDGGTATLTELVVGDNGWGSVAVTNGVLDVEELLWKKRNSAGANRLLAGPGARISLPASTCGAAAKGTAALVFDGGTVVLKGTAPDGASCADYLRGVDDVRVAAAGGTLTVPDGAAATVTQTLTGTGRLRKAGAGTLTLAGGLAGPELDLTDGTVALPTSGTLDALRYASKGRLSLADGKGGTWTIRALRPATPDVALAVAIDLADTVAFASPVDLAGRRLAFSCARCTTGRTFTLATWEGANPPDAVTLAVPEGLVATVTVDAAKKTATARVDVNRSETTPLSAWTVADGAWDQAANWTALPSPLASVWFDDRTKGNAAVTLAEAARVREVAFTTPCDVALKGASLAVTRGVSVSGGGRAAFQLPLATPQATVSGGVLAFSDPTGVESIALTAGQVEVTGTPEKAVSTAFSFVPPQTTQAGVFRNADNLVWTGPFTATGPLVKLGAGTLTLAGRSQFSGDGYWINAGDVPLAFDAATRTPRTGYRGVGVYEGTLVLDPGAGGSTELYGAVLAGGWTTRTGAETAGHILVKSGRVVANDWFTVGRNNGTSVTAPEGLVSTFTIGADVETISCSGIWLASMTGTFRDSTSRAWFIVNGGTMTVKGPNSDTGICFGNAAAPAAVAAPVFELNGGTVEQIGSRGLQLAAGAGWKGTAVLNGGTLTVEKVSVASGGAGEIVFNGGALGFGKTASLGSQAGLTLTLAKGGATLQTDTVLSLEGAFTPTADAGPVVKRGSGGLYVKASQTYTSPTILEEGSVRLYDGVSLASAVTNRAAFFALVDGKAGSTAAVRGLAMEAGTLVLEASADGKTVDRLTVDGPVTGTFAVQIRLVDYTVPDWRGHTFDVLAYTGDAPDVTGWTLEGAPNATFTAANGKVTVDAGAAPEAVATWTNAVGGAWAAAENWDAAPAAPAVVRFADRPAAGAAIALPASGVSMQELVQTTGHALTFTDGAAMWADQALMTLGAGAAVAFTEPLTLNGRLAVTAAGSAVVDLAALAGTGLYAQRGGRLALTNAAAAACTVPLQLRNVELFELGSGTHAFPFTAEDVVFAPTSGATAVVTPTALRGLTRKTLVSTLEFAAGTDLSTVQDLRIGPGCVSADSAPRALALNGSTFRYTGTAAAQIGDFEGLGTGAATFDVADAAATLALTGRVANTGILVKRGAGTLRLAGAGVQTLAASYGTDPHKRTIDAPAHGASPTRGTRSVNVLDGTLEIDGGTYEWFNTLAVGMASTTAPDAETAGRVVVKAGCLRGQQFALARGNGTAETAKTPRVSELVIAGGRFEQYTLDEKGGLFACTVMEDQTAEDVNGRARVRQTGGAAFFGGCLWGPEAPRGVLTLDLSGGTFEICRNANLTRVPGAETTVNVSGGADVSFGTTNGVVNFCTAEADGTAARAKAAINLDGGIFRARSFACGTGGEGTLAFNGGTLVPLASGEFLPPNGQITVTVGERGGTIDVPEGVVAEIAHDLAGGGVLSVTGGGVLGLAADVAGGLAVSGTLRLDVGAAPPPVVAGALTFAAGARLTFAGDGVETLRAGDRAPLLTAGGFAGVENLVCADDAPLAGTFAVEGGTLYLTVTANRRSHVWAAATGGAWSVAENWDNPPDGGTADAIVSFGPTLAAAGTVTLDEPATVGALRFESPHAYTLAGAGTLTFAGGEPSVTVVQGTHAVAAPLALAGNATVALGAHALALTGGVSGPGGLVVKKTTGTLKLAGANTFAGGLDMRASCTVELDGTSPAGFGELHTIGGCTVGVPEGRTAYVPGVFSAGNAEGALTLAVPGAGTALENAGAVRFSEKTGKNSNMSLRKTGAGTWTLAGDLSESADHGTKLLMYGGTVRVTDGARVDFGSKSDRASIDFNFNNLTDGTVLNDRRFVVERGAVVTTGGIFLGGWTKYQEVSVRTRGVLELQRRANVEDGFVVGNNNGSTGTWVKVESGGTLRAADTRTYVSLGAYQDRNVHLCVDGGLAAFANLTFGFNEATNDRSGGVVDVVVTNGGTLRVFNKLNWMGDTNTDRVHTLAVRRGGTLELCDTGRSVPFGGGRSTLTLDGGRIAYVPGGVLHTNGNWFAGLNAWTLGESDTTLDVGASDVTVTQRLVAAMSAGSLVKVGTGTLTLTAPPRTRGEVRVQEGMLALTGTGTVEEEDGPDGTDTGLRVRVAAEAGITNGVAQTYALLGGAGAVRGEAAVVAGVLDPGTREAEAGATLALDALTFADGATNRCDVVFDGAAEPEAGDRFAVSGTLTVAGAGVVDVGLPEEAEMPLRPSAKRIVLGTYGTLVGGENLSGWRLVHRGRPIAGAAFTAKAGVLAVSFCTGAGTVLFLR